MLLYDIHHNILKNPIMVVMACYDILNMSDHHFYP